MKPDTDLPTTPTAPAEPQSGSHEIVGVRTVRLSRLLSRDEPRYSNDWRALKVDRAFVEVNTAGGEVGLGELAASGSLAEAERFADWISRRAVGRHLADAFELCRPSGSSRSWDAAAAAVDSAIWDAIACRAHVPLHENLSGENAHPLPVPATADAGCCLDWGNSTDAILEEAAACATFPFHSYSLRLGTAWEWDHIGPTEFLALAWEVHSELGETLLVVDAEERLTVRDALELADGLSEIGCTTLRRPFPITEVDAYRALAAAQAGLAITAGGTLTTYDRLLPFLEEGLLGGIEFEIGLCGISEARKRCLLASDYALPAHAVGETGAIGALASAHVLAAHSVDGHVHIPYSSGRLVGGILDESLTLRRGSIALPRGSGLGIQLTPGLEALFPWIEGSSSVLVQR